MPNMDGFMTALKLRENELTQRIPILMITSLKDKEDKIKALECGINDFVSKPFDKIELITRCKSYINMDKLNRKYILASKNPNTNLANKTALKDDISNNKYNQIILFKIENYTILEEFYTYEVAKKIEYEFSHKLKTLLPKSLENEILYHTADGEFATIYSNNPIFEKEFLIMKELNIFLEQVRSISIIVDGFHYDINILISFCTNLLNIFESARVGLNFAMTSKYNIVFANNIVENYTKDANQNLKTLKIIKEAIKAQKIFSYLQPIYNNTTNRIEKYESLVRLETPNGEILFPNSFLNVAKKAGYYLKITNFVIDNAFHMLKYSDYDISINLSVLDISDNYLRKHIINIIKENINLTNRIVFELLEDENCKDFDLIKDFIKEIKSYGVKIAIDDFGSGYSNFERLLSLEPDILKIDGSLVKNINKDPYSLKIVETIHTFASKMGILTVAEFVYDKEIFEIINKIGINFSQGYYIGKPENSELVLKRKK
ncbi:EAL domain-containing protein [Arcobacter sp. FWKO B]|nr:EAL domain-containing protein [Arcobacter sp. FWKO B]